MRNASILDRRMYKDGWTLLDVDVCGQQGQSCRLLHLSKVCIALLTPIPILCSNGDNNF